MTKYPRTLHCPWSLGRGTDDKVLDDMSPFVGQSVIVTEKMDGENTTIGRDYVHARSLDSTNHLSRNWVKNYASTFQHGLGDLRLCGENMYATHSIAYDKLESYFYLFGLWEDKHCLNYGLVEAFAYKFHITLPRVLYRGIYNEKLIKGLDYVGMEGYVIRTVDGFMLDRFSTSVAKCVRADHVQTDAHWMHSEMIINRLKHNGTI